MKCHLIQFMECNLVYSAGVRLWDVIGFIQQDLGYEMSLESKLGAKITSRGQKLPLARKENDIDKHPFSGIRLCRCKSRSGTF